MSSPVIKVENLSKQYRLGQVGTGSLSHDINRLWHRARGKEDPYLKIGEENNCESKGNSDYVWALKDICFDIQQGDRVGIIGRNGAGKSTLLKILSRTTSPTSGSVKIKGRVASLLEVGTGFHPDLSGRDNIFLNGAILGMSKQDIKSRFDEIVDFAGVERYIDTPVKRYSSGMYVRLAFAVAAHLESDILIVDEVLAVGDAEFQKKCLGKMGEVSEGEGRTVLFVSHNIIAVNQLCNQLILLQTGRVKYKGNVEEGFDIYNRNIKKNYASEFRLPKTRELEWKAAYIDTVIIENRQFTDLANDENLIFNIRIKCNRTITNHRLAIRIKTSDMIPVGLLFSDDQINLNSGEISTLSLELNNHNLARGLYFLDFSIGTGNEVMVIEDVHIIENALVIEITRKNFLTQSKYVNWNSNNWGNHNYNTTLLTVIDSKE